MGVSQMGLHLTDRCQLDCQHCLRDPAKKPRDLPLDLIENVLDQVKRLHGTTHVSLTGGEPSLHPEFIAIVDAIAERGMTWHMMSNGRGFARLMNRIDARAERRRAFTQVYFSLDGSDAETHDRIRGQGSFRDVMTACAVATAYGVPFALQLVVNAKNEHQIESLGLLASQLGAMRVSYCVLQPSGTPHDDALKLSLREWSAVRDRIDRLAQILTIDVRTPEGWPQDQPFHVCEVFQSAQLHVDVEGRLNLCCQHADVPASEEGGPSGESDAVADLRETTLAEAQLRLLGVIHRAQVAKLKQIASGHFGGWDHLGCNWCLKYFGKPHWDDGGAMGPQAARERWVGAWGARKDQAPNVRLPIVQGRG